MKKSIIKKSISRKVCTAPYETLDVHVEIVEEVEWENMDERMKKTEAISKILIIDFVKTLNRVAEELNVDKKVAQVSGQKKAESPKENTANVSIDSNKDGGDFDFLK
jgi:hypothetical protein